MYKKLFSLECGQQDLSCMVSAASMISAEPLRTLWTRHFTLAAESEILTISYYFLAASAAKNCEKIAVIKSAASEASAKGGCASSRLDHGLKFYVIPGGCASSRLISEFSECVDDRLDSKLLTF